MVPYLVCEFSQRTLSNLVKECFGSDFPDVFKKEQITYIFNYLTDLGAKSILLEREYQDHDYLEDYSRYYVKCFKNSGHKCARLHFFSKELKHGSFDQVLMGDCDPSIIQSSYLGFIVIKPLPKTFIGKTCLRLYPGLTQVTSESNCLSRRYQISLFGIELTVDSIAFQEQDQVVSACATTAIWTALHGCAWKNDRQIPACSEITTNAINHIDGSSNRFPNKGLTTKQILRALDVEGLRHHLEPIETASKGEIFDAVRTHIDSGVPVILGAEIYDRSGKHLGGHAVTILGYKKENERISFYVHDDRLGPFAKAVIVARSVKRGRRQSSRSERGGKWQLTLQRKDSKGNWLTPHEYLSFFSLIIPTHKKVRIPYVLPLNTCHLMVREFELWLKKQETEVRQLGEGLNFSLRLYQVSEINKTILDTTCNPNHNDPEVYKRDRVDFLTKSRARFQWVASFRLKDLPVFKVLFDATDIPQGNAVSGIFVENMQFARSVLKVYRDYKGVEIESPNESFILTVYKFLEDSESNYDTYLDKTYGNLRAPSYLKETEIIDGDIYKNKWLRIFYENPKDPIKIEDLFPSPPEGCGLIWAIAADGSLRIGIEIQGEGKGHPTLTGYSVARIAGELKRMSNSWGINSKSGRYSSDYSNSQELLENALHKFKTIFPLSSDRLYILPNDVI